MAEKLDKPIGLTAKPTHSQEYYDDIKHKFAEERDLRLRYRPEGTVAIHLRPRPARWRSTRSIPTPTRSTPRAPINDTVECLFIGGGFSALLTSARLRECGVESIRIVERGADVGGTWYWNRYPGAACDVVVLRLPAAARRDGLRAVATTTRRARRSSRIARRSPESTTSTSWPSSRPP